ncbi:MAG: 4Fe-4S ferredoxin, partial [Aeromicrobium sp.]
LLARRGVAQAAFTLPELIGLLGHDDVDFVVDRKELVLDPATAVLRESGGIDPGLERKIAAMEDLAWQGRRPGNRRRIVFRYLMSPTEFTGTGVRASRNELKVDGDGTVRAMQTSAVETIEAGLFLRSIGYRGIALPDVPFDEGLGVIPNELGRVVEASGTYAAGWIKRGPTGYIGTNKTCAQETVSSLLTDFNAGLLPAPGRTRTSLSGLVAKRRPETINLRGWRAIDELERRRGSEAGKVRQKLTDTSEMVQVATQKSSAKRRGVRVST